MGLSKIRAAWPEVKIDLLIASPGVCLQTAKEGFSIELKEDEMPNFWTIAETQLRALEHRNNSESRQNQTMYFV